MNTPAVAYARTQLTEAEAVAAKERRAALVAQLKSTRAELRTHQRTLEKLKRQIFKGQADLDNCRREIGVVSEALAMFESRKPAVADHLPDDPETVQWRNQCNALESELERLRKKRMALPNLSVLRGEGVTLAQRVQALQFSESNILSALDGTLAQSPVGGIFAPQ
jgi:predicted  nucleic acid-binding Zn-ribbon protein